ncbi:50S ribosomal protein L23 [Candidatus Saccharibacteria bacterium]|nr:50S ribosomal protein L23 [Candidatus Saccharibacteria bacterium]
MADKKTTKVTTKKSAEIITEPKFAPRATEKTYTEQRQRTYAFFVDKGMSKQAIAKQIAEDYNVKVTDVRTLIRKGKPTRFSRGKHAYPGTTHRQDHKLAYVTLAEGNSIKVFDEEEPQEVTKDDTKKAPKTKEEKK